MYCLKHPNTIMREIRILADPIYVLYECKDCEADEMWDEEFEEPPVRKGKFRPEKEEE